MNSCHTAVLNCLGGISETVLSPPPGSAEKAILNWIEDWCDLLAEDRIAEACARLDEPNAYGHDWSADDIIAARESTFDPQSRFARTHPEGLAFTRPGISIGSAFASIGQLDDGSGYWAEYSLPISGEFSDLTAQFRFRWARGRLLVSLRDLRVL